MRAEPAQRTAGAVAAPAAPPSSETGWLPDCVYTGGKFESGLAFFADAMGRITRFSREPADTASARRLAGQAALPGLVNGHSHALERVIRGRCERRPRAGPDAVPGWREARDQAVGRMSGEDVFDTARMAFMEMMLSGITCVGEFHYLHNPPDGASWPDPNFLGQEILRAAHDLGIRIALLKVASARGCPARFATPSADRFIAEAGALERFVTQNYHVDEAWVGVAPHSLAAVPPDYLKAVAAFAHAQRMRLHLPLSEQPADNEACIAENGRTPVALLAKLGLLDKRFTAIHAIHLTDEDVQLLGAARATVCACPTSERNLGSGAPPVERLLAAGAAVSLGTAARSRSTCSRMRACWNTTFACSGAGARSWRPSPRRPFSMRRPSRERAASGRLAARSSWEGRPISSRSISTIPRSRGRSRMRCSRTPCFRSSAGRSGMCGSARASESRTGGIRSTGPSSAASRIFSAGCGPDGRSGEVASLGGDSRGSGEGKGLAERNQVGAYRGEFASGGMVGIGRRGRRAQPVQAALKDNGRLGLAQMTGIQVEAVRIGHALATLSQPGDGNAAQGDVAQGALGPH